MSLSKLKIIFVALEDKILDVHIYSLTV